MSGLLCLQKQESVKSEEPVKKESVTPQMKKGVTPLKISGVTPQVIVFTVGQVKYLFKIFSIVYSFIQQIMHQVSTSLAEVNQCGTFY